MGVARQRNRADDPLLLTVEQAAALCGISRSHAFNLVQRGAWPVVRWGRVVRVPRGWLEAAIQARVEAWQGARETRGGGR